MFEQMVRRVEAGAAEAVRLRTAAVAEAFREAVPGGLVTIAGDSVVVRARGLVRRWLESAALRAIGVAR